MRHFLLFGFLLLTTFLSSAQPDENGSASYYAKKFQGRMTANGEIFNNYDYTAAHRSLPFNTYLNVVNEENNYNIIVRVNDRGPYAKKRIIDLSEAAARRIGAYHHGHVPVKIEVLDIVQLTPELEEAFSKPVVDCLGNESELEKVSLSLWSTSDLVHAIYIANDLYIKENIDQVIIATKKTTNGPRYHVIITGFPDKKEAARAKDFYERKGFMKVNIFTP